MKLIPQSLATRIFLMYAITMSLFIATGLGLFYRAQFTERIEEAQQSANMLIDVAGQAVEESAVIGDYDTVRRTLAKTVASPIFSVAEFIDMKGSVVKADDHVKHEATAPSWLTRMISERVFNANRNIVVGGRDYGVMRLTFDVEEIALSLWGLIVQGTVLGSLFMLGSMVLIHAMTRKWLGSLQRLKKYQDKVLAGEIDAEAQAVGNEPAEILQALEVVNRTSAKLRNQFGQQIDSLMNSLLQHKNAMDKTSIVAELDLEGRITYINELFTQASGYSQQELIGKKLVEIGMQQCEADNKWDLCQTLWQAEMKVSYSESRGGWYRRTIVPIMGGSDLIEKFICIDIDITDRKESEQTLQKHAHRQGLMAAFGKDALESDQLEPLWERAVEVAARGLRAPHSAFLRLDHEAGTASLQAGVGLPLLWKGQGIASADDLAYTLLSANHAEVIPDMASAYHDTGCGLLCDIRMGSGIHVPIMSSGGQHGVLGVYAGVTHHFGEEDMNFLESIGTTLVTAIEAHEATSKLTYMAQYDTLTSLPNRARLMERLQEDLTHATRNNQFLGVMFIDLDRFKIVNDTLGHGVGDLLLVQAGQRLRQSVRVNDFVARLGGDEFAVVLSNLHHRDDAIAIAQKIIKALAKPFSLSGQQVYVSASVGIAIYPDDGVDASYLIQCADAAMYGAKRAGRNAYQVYLPQMSKGVQQRMQLETQLREALEKDELKLLFQPKVSLVTGGISGFEALLRWQPENQAMVPPDKFIPIMEEIGLIVPVGEWVVKTVCAQIRRWVDTSVPLRPIAINLSARQFQQQNLASRIGEIIAEAGIDPSYLEFELTESMLMVDPEAAALTLRDLKAFGVRLSVDDFGTGYSSLAYLKRFPLDKLKIDRAFVRDVSTDSDDAAIAMAIISLAHNLNLTVVAEGVETSEQLNLLIQNGCDEMQGYYFSRPIHESACVDMLQQDIRLHGVWPARAA